MTQQRWVCSFWGSRPCFTGLNFIVLYTTSQRPGMTWFGMPLFCWALYATAIIQVLATPVLGITLVLLILERLFGIGRLRSGHGWRPGALCAFLLVLIRIRRSIIMILPEWELSARRFPVFSHKKIFGYKAIAFSSLGIAFVSFMVRKPTCSPADNRNLPR